MQYPFYLVRITERAISWFFEPTIDKIWCRSMAEVQEHYQEEDVLYALDRHTGAYVKCKSFAEAELAYYNEYMRNNIPDDEYYKERAVCKWSY